MRLVIKNKPKNKTSSLMKFSTAISIAMGVALLLIGYTDNESAILASSALSGIATFFVV